jgi:hypothetical protein
MKKSLKSSRKTGQSGQASELKNPDIVNDLDEVDETALSLEEDLRKMEDENRRLRSSLRETQRESTLFKELSGVIKQQPPFSTFAPYVITDTKKSAITESAVLVISDCHGDQEILGKRVQNLEEYNFDVACIRAQRIVETTITHLKDNMKGYHFERLYVAGLGDYVNGDIHKATEHSKWKNALKNAMGMGELFAMMITELSRHFPEIVFTSVAGNHGRRSIKKDYRGAQDNWDYLVACHAATRLQGLIDEKRLRVFFPDSWSMGLSIYDWNFVLNHGDDIRCFVPGAPVTVSNYTTKPIEELNIDDKVLCSDGILRAIKNKFEYDHDGDIVNISAYGLPETTWKVTPNHEVMVVKGQKVLNKVPDTTPEWMPAGHVSVGDYLVVPCPKQEAVVNSLCVADYTTDLPKIQHHNEIPIPETIPVGKDIGYILGQYLGDGCVFGKKDKVKGSNYHNIMEITYNEEELAFWEDLIKSSETLFNITPKLINRKDMTVRAQRVFIYSQRVANLIATLGGRGSHTKVIHEDVLNWNKEALKWLLIGYLRADGHTHRRKFHDKWRTHIVAASTCSRKLGYQLFWIAKLCGYNPSIKLRQRSGSKEAVLSFYGDDARELGPLTQRNYVSEDDGVLSSRKVIKCDDYSLVLVRKCYREHYKGKKYDIEVEGTHDYTVNCAVVHNSWNSVPWYGIERKTRRLNAIGAVTGEIPNYFLLGHFHNMASQQHTTGETIINSSWAATDEYALNSLGAYSEPYQWLFGVHPQYGISWRLPIKLRTTDWKKNESSVGRYSVTIFEDYERGVVDLPR